MYARRCLETSRRRKLASHCCGGMLPACNVGCFCSVFSRTWINQPTDLAKDDQMPPILSEWNYNIFATWRRIRVIQNRRQLEASPRLTSVSVLFFQRWYRYCLKLYLFRPKSVRFFSRHSKSKPREVGTAVPRSPCVSVVLGALLAVADRAQSELMKQVVGVIVGRFSCCSSDPKRFCSYLAICMY